MKAICIKPPYTPMSEGRVVELERALSGFNALLDLPDMIIVEDISQFTKAVIGVGYTARISYERMSLKSATCTGYVYRGKLIEIMGAQQDVEEEPKRLPKRGMSAETVK